MKRARIAGLASGLLWGLDTFLLALATVQWTQDPRWAALAPVLSTFLHDLFSALWLCLYVGVRGQLRALQSKLRHRPARQVLLAALLGGPLGMSAYVFSIHLLGPGQSAVISSFFPAVGAALAHFFLRQRMRLHQWIALGLGILAVICLSVEGEISSVHSLSGLFCALLCVLCWALESVLCSAAMAPSHPYAVTEEEAIVLRQTLSAVVFACVLIPGFGAGSIFPSLLQLQTGPFLLVIGGIGAASFLLYYHCIRKLGAGRGMALNITYCAWAMILQSVYARSFPSLIQLGAAVVLILSSLVAAGAIEDKLVSLRRHNT